MDQPKLSSIYTRTVVRLEVLQPLVVGDLMRIQSILVCGTTVLPGTKAVNGGFRWVVKVVPNESNSGDAQVFEGDVSFSTESEAQDEAAWQAEVIAHSIVDALH
jgi:hypothetical protein